MNCFCKQPDNKAMVQCDTCKVWIHLACDNLTQKKAESLTTYQCPACIKKKNLYDVEKITAHRFIDTRREFFIMWTGYTEGTWEPEEHLATCVNILNEYLKKHKLEPIKLVPLGGATLNKPTNHNNWVTMDQLLRFISQHRVLKSYRDGLDIIEWNHQQLGTKDTIYVLLWAGHFYVLLDWASKQKRFLADGNNTYLTDLKIKNEIQLLIGKSTIGCTFIQQQGADHCDSLAAGIALEFVRLHKRNMEPSSIRSQLSQVDTGQSQSSISQEQKCCYQTSTTDDMQYSKIAMSLRLFRYDEQASLDDNASIEMQVQLLTGHMFKRM